MSDRSRTSSTPVTAGQFAAHAEAILRLLDRPIPAHDLDAGAELAARPAETGSRRSVRLLLFRIGGELAALPAKLLQRVTPMARPSPIPHRTAGVLRGVCNIRGELVLCADLHRLLGMPARDGAGVRADSASDPRRMVVVGPADNSWAFEVDALLGVESVDPETFRSPPVTVEYSIGDYTLGVTEIGGRCVTVLDGGHILAGFKAALA